MSSAAEPTPAAQEASAVANNIEADAQTGAEEDDSDYYSGSDGSSYATSLATAIKNHTYDNGRRYNSYKDKHWGPNDERQQNTMDMLHHTFCLVRGGKLHSAPIGDNPQKILDLGTGTGINAIDIADQYPSAQVIGNDLSPIQPAWVPTNCQFEIDDFNTEWAYKPNTFDFVNGRCLFGSVTDWNKLYKEAFKVIKPGGYMESTEYGILPLCDDKTLPEDSDIMEAAKLSVSAGEKMGRSFQVIDDIAKAMEEAGFVDIKTETYVLPMNSWPKDPKMKEVGRFFLASMVEGMPGFFMYIYTAVLGMEKDKVQEYVDKTLKQMKNRACHGYYPLRVVYGRKPETE